MKTDIEIAQEAELRPIQEIAAKIGLGPEDIVPFGHHKAKIPLETARSKGSSDGRLVLVTGISPTPAGEGKSTTSVGLADAFTLREMDEKTSDEICKDLEVSPSNLWVLLHRARLRLANCLKTKWQAKGEQSP